MELNITDQGFPEEARVLAPWAWVYKRNWKHKLAFATSLVSGPQAVSFFGSSGSGYRSEAETAINYHPEKFLQYLEDSEARFLRSQGAPANERQRLEDALYQDTHSAAAALALNQSGQLPPEVDQALGTYREIATHLSAAEVISYLAGASRNPQAFDPLRELMLDRKVAGEDLVDLLTPIIRGGLEKHLYGASSAVEKNRLGEELHSFTKAYGIKYGDLIAAARAAGRGFRR